MMPTVRPLCPLLQLGAFDPVLSMTVVSCKVTPKSVKTMFETESQSIRQITL